MPAAILLKYLQAATPEMPEATPANPAWTSGLNCISFAEFLFFPMKKTASDYQP
jgi:hypothetical protein